jgi:hypothetical protein
MSKDIKLNADELENVKRIIENSPSHYWLRIMERCQFEVGDVLIKMQHEYNYDSDDEDDPGSFKPEQVSDKSRCNRKYKCVYVDPFGVPYIKVIKTNGELGDNLICAATHDPAGMFFTADPDYAEHLILAPDGTEFNPAEAFAVAKKHRNEVSKYNKSLRMKAKSLRDADALIRTVKAGDKIWAAWKGDDHNAHENEFVVTSKFSKTVEKLIDESYGEAKDQFATFKKTETFQILRLKRTKDGDTGELYAGSIFFGERYVYSKKPRSYEVGQ